MLRLRAPALRGLGPFLIGASVALTLTLWMGSKIAREDWFAHTSLYGSKTCALTAITLMGWILLLATRAPILEHIFGGVDQCYRWHRRLGTATGILLTLHPLFLAGPRLPHVGHYLAYLFLPYPYPQTQYEVGGNVGMLCYWALVVLLLLAHRPTRPYQKWLRQHRWMGAVYLFAMLHVALVNRDIALYLGLKVWMWAWLGVGALSLIWIRLHRFLGTAYAFRVAEIKEEEQLVMLHLTPDGPPFPFKPGQWALIEAPDIGEPGERHPLSIACAPREDGQLVLGVRQVGPWTTSLSDLKKGARVWVYGPFGMLADPFLAEGEKVVCIGGGIGITPFLGIWEYAHHAGVQSEDPKMYDTELADCCRLWRNPDVQLFYLVKDPREAIFDRWIRQTAIAGKFHSHLVQPHSYELVISPLSSPVSLRAISEKAGGLEGKRILLCGPTPMIKAFIEEARVLGLDPDRISFEAFEWRRDS